MATRVINSVITECVKVFSGTCTNCDKRFCVGWRMDEQEKLGVANYCYNCTNNQWKTAFKLHRLKGT